MAIDESMGWSDDPNDELYYNRLISLPYQGSHEVLWRDDRLYDIVSELGYNDDPPTIGGGSAIFLHVARPDYSPTQGCVALPVHQLRELLATLEPEPTLTVVRAGAI
jgi:L,D-peptidoglycan transpeptidase YkuD (ErfK/YbiS/YcfS/YnhG family)